MAVDRKRITALVGQLLEAIGDDPRRPGLLSAPDEVAGLYTDIFEGVGQDAAAFLADATSIQDRRAFAGAAPPIALRDIRFRSTCEHHLLPFRGTVDLAFLPGNRVAPAESVARAVKLLASRPQVQERLGEEIADVIEASLEARGVLVILSATHDCVTMRGGRQTGASAVTIAARGRLREPSARSVLVGRLTDPPQALPRSDPARKRAVIRPVR